MQSKVSLVMPCYNKVKAISSMFESILAQNWDNIELILVNDGSTDGTRDIISAYEPKFQERGYDVVIIDQKNAGVCAAAKNGLQKFSGDYVCCIDSDDELEPNYVSSMASWLDTHPDCDYTMCTYKTYTFDAFGNKVYGGIYPLDASSERGKLVERYLLMDLPRIVWVYMVRRAYFEKCKIAQTYYTKTKQSHEPGFVIPLHAYGGNMKLINEPLYHFDNTDDVSHHSCENTIDGAVKRYNEYARLQNIAIDCLEETAAPLEYKALLKRFVECNRIKCIYKANMKYSGESNTTTNLMEEYIAAFYNAYKAEPNPRHVALIRKGIFQVCNEILLNQDKEIQKLKIPKPRRIIGYGCLGTNARELLPLLAETDINPSELWDSAGNGEFVITPNWDTVTNDDLILIFPSKKNIVSEILKELKERELKNFILYNDIIRYLLAEKDEYSECYFERNK